MALSVELEEAVEYIKSVADTKPELGIILGTGMANLANAVQDAHVIDYYKIPHFPVSTVESHKGKLHLGNLEGKRIFMMQGRFHYYEGYSMQKITFPIRVMKALGIKTLIVMNAVGSMNPLIPTGSLVLVQDHINLMGDNPLIGPNDENFGPRFPDMSEPYTRELIALAEQTALEEKIPGVHRGIMVSVTGPNLETAAEYRMFQRIGADIVTMSTVPEVIVAVHASMRVLAISTVTDACLPDNLHAVNLQDMLSVVDEVQPRLGQLVAGVVRRMKV